MSFLMLLACALAVCSCNKDDDFLSENRYEDETTEGSGSYGSLEMLKGTWICYCDSVGTACVIAFENNGLGGLQDMWWNYSKQQYEKSGDIEYFRYSYDTQNGIVSVNQIDPNTGEDYVGTDAIGRPYADTWKVISLKQDSMTFKRFSYTYKAVRYNGNGGGNGNGSGDKEPIETQYAPNDMSGYLLTLTYSNNIYTIYFINNTTISPASDAAGLVLNGATYEKTGAKTATVSCTTSYTYHAYLTFTSYSSGTFSWSTGATGTFTIKEEQAPTNIEAPEYIGYKTFTDSPGSVETSIKFGSQNGSKVYVTDASKWHYFSQSSSLYDRTYNVTYTRTSQNSANLVIKETSKSKSGSTTFTDTWDYQLTFTASSAKGNYSCHYSTTSRYGTSNTKTGTFTLQ